MNLDNKIFEHTFLLRSIELVDVAIADLVLASFSIANFFLGVAN